MQKLVKSYYLPYFHLVCKIYLLNELQKYTTTNYGALVEAKKYISMPEVIRPPPITMTSAVNEESLKALNDLQEQYDRLEAKFVEEKILNYDLKQENERIKKTAEGNHSINKALN